MEAERESKFIGRITLLRHGQTDYTNVFPDLTQEGEETIRKTAEQIALNLQQDEEVTIMSSDKARAQGTAAIIKNVLEHEREVRIVPGITSMAHRHPERSIQMINEMLAEKGSVQAVDYAYTHDPRFDDAELWEPRNEIQKRFFRNIEYAIRAFKRVAEHEDLPSPHLVAVTHFEVLSPFVGKIFNLKHPEEPTLKNGELIEMSVLDPSQGQENSDVVLLKMTFRGMKKTVGFDRKNRDLVLVE